MTANRDDYLLGFGAREWSRLQEQHLVWRDTLLDAIDLKPGMRVLEVGCGPGFLLADLAQRVGPTGRALGIELDGDSVGQAARWLSDHRLDHARVQQGDALTADLGGPWDCIVMRWLLCFLPEPGELVKRLASALAPGGRVWVQDYDHDAFRLVPDDEGAASVVIEALRAMWRDRGGDLWVALRLPELFAAAGLETLALTPHIKIGRPGDSTWRWIERFLHEHIDTIVESGHLSPAEREAFEASWARHRDEPAACVVSPVVVQASGVRRQGSAGACPDP